MCFSTPCSFLSLWGLKLLPPTPSFLFSRRRHLRWGFQPLWLVIQSRPWMLSHFSFVGLFGTLWTVADQAPLSMGFSRQEYWNGLPFPPPGDLPGLSHIYILLNFCLIFSHSSVSCQFNSRTSQKNLEREREISSLTPHWMRVGEEQISKWKQDCCWKQSS